MFGCECICWDRIPEISTLDQEPEPFSLPAALPEWPEGNGFSNGSICLGEIEVVKITKFVKIWSCTHFRGKQNCFLFYKPADIPHGFSNLGHYCQSNDEPLRGYVLVARIANVPEQNTGFIAHSMSSDSDLPLRKPRNYSLIWSSDSDHNGRGYFWLPNPPSGYKAMGIIVTDKPDEPSTDEVRCVREDLAADCETSNLLFTMESKFTKTSFHVWNTRPCDRGMSGQGVPVGTFFCSNYLEGEEKPEIACFKNLNTSLPAMPNLNQLHALINHYGPMVYFHPDETYMPSSVPWFFKNGALLYAGGGKQGERIDCRGSNLPNGGCNDGDFWIDLPEDDDARNILKKGNLESAELYVHVKPASGGTFTDIAMWIFCPFNGPATIKAGFVNISLSKIGEHVGDWEHFTLRVSNFTGELWSVFFSQHSGGGWVDASDLEYIKGNQAIVYSSKHGHASFPHPGLHLQGSSKLKVGVRNDTGKSQFLVDSSTQYQLVAAEYLGDGVVTEPCWLQYMREWGPTIVYDSRSELDKLMDLLPVFFRFSMESIFDLFPTELYGEEGPTGPKEKDNWEGDEIC